MQFFGIEDIGELIGVSVKNQGRVGDTIDSMLTPEQFINQNDPGWVLADGRTVVGTDYKAITGQTVIPDMRGQFKRGKNRPRNSS